MIMIKLLYYYNLHFRIISNEESGVKHSRHGDDIFKNRVVDLFEYSKGESFCRREIMKIGHDDVMTILLFCLWESQFFLRQQIRIYNFTYVILHFFHSAFFLVFS